MRKSNNIFFLLISIFFLSFYIIHAQEGIIFSVDGSNCIKNDIYQINLDLDYNISEITNENWWDFEVDPNYNSHKQFQEIFLDYCKVGITLTKNPEEKIKLFPQFKLLNFSGFFNIKSSNNSLFVKGKLLDFNSQLPFLKIIVCLNWNHHMDIPFTKVWMSIY